MVSDEELRVFASLLTVKFSQIDNADTVNDIVLLDPTFFCFTSAELQTGEIGRFANQERPVFDGFFV